MLMHTPVDPAPPISRRILGVRHVRGLIEAPRGVLLAAYDPAATEEWPDSARSTRVPGGILLAGVSEKNNVPMIQKGKGGTKTNKVDRVDEREHGRGIPVYNEGPVELVRALSCLFDGNGGVRLAEGRRLA